jgi:hypothetical protein
MDEEIGLLDEECAICYETMCEYDLLEPCGHRIHTRCFLMTRSNQCPICRQVVRKPKPNVKYLLYQRENIPPVQLACIFAFICFTYLVLIIIGEYKDAH